MPATSRTLSDRKVTTEVMGNRTVDSREMVGTVYEEAVKRGEHEDEKMLITIMHKID